MPIHLCRIAMHGRVIRDAIDLLQAGEAIGQAPNRAAIRFWISSAAARGSAAPWIGLPTTM